MKKIKIETDKLRLKKQKIADLNKEEMGRLVGGTSGTCPDDAGCANTSPQATCGCFTDPSNGYCPGGNSWTCETLDTSSDPDHCGNTAQMDCTSQCPSTQLTCVCYG